VLLLYACIRKIYSSNLVQVTHYFDRYKFLAVVSVQIVTFWIRKRFSVGEEDHPTSILPSVSKCKHILKMEAA
jgi:hypothetical protein